MRICKNTQQPQFKCGCEKCKARRARQREAYQRRRKAGKIRRRASTRKGLPVSARGFSWRDRASGDGPLPVYPSACPQGE